MITNGCRYRRKVRRDLPSQLSPHVEKQALDLANDIIRLVRDRQESNKLPLDAALLAINTASHHID